CAFLRRDGNLGKPRPCRPPRYLRAAGARRWSLRVETALPKGRYVVRTRAIDRRGVAGRRSVRRLHVR
ncbi:MAG: hypothetical protein ABIO51_07460, partial [Solirubrobacteraceae bacterium]